MSYISILLNHLGTFKTELFYSLFLVSFLVFFYKTFSFYINKQETSHEKKDRALINARNFLIFIFVILSFFIWIGEIKTSLISAAALGGAIIITYKEIILSFFGTIISNQTFELGDYIEIDGLPGKIINKSFLNTTILLNDTQQTQELIVPNLIFLNNKFKKLSKIPKVQFVSFGISVDNINKIYYYSEIAKNIAKEVLFKHDPSFDDYLKQVDKTTPYFVAPESIVNIGFEVADSRKLQIIVSFVCRPSLMSELKSEILNQYLQKINE